MSRARGGGGSGSVPLTIGHPARTYCSDPSPRGEGFAYAAAGEQSAQRQAVPRPAGGGRRLGRRSPAPHRLSVAPRTDRAPVRRAASGAAAPAAAAERADPGAAGRSGAGPGGAAVVAADVAAAPPGAVLGAGGDGAGGFGGVDPAPGAAADRDDGAAGGPGPGAAAAAVRTGGAGLAEPDGAGAGPAHPVLPGLGGVRRDHGGHHGERLGQ